MSGNWPWAQVWLFTNSVALGHSLCPSLRAAGTEEKKKTLPLQRAWHLSTTCHSCTRGLGWEPNHQVWCCPCVEYECPLWGHQGPTHSSAHPHMCPSPVRIRLCFPWHSLQNIHTVSPLQPQPRSFLLTEAATSAGQPRSPEEITDFLTRVPGPFPDTPQSSALWACFLMWRMDSWFPSRCAVSVQVRGCEQKPGTPQACDIKQLPFTRPTSCSASDVSEFRVSAEK